MRKTWINRIRPFHDTSFLFVGRLAKLLAKHFPEYEAPVARVKSRSGGDGTVPETTSSHGVTLCTASNDALGILVEAAAHGPRTLPSGKSSFRTEPIDTPKGAWSSLGRSRSLGGRGGGLLGGEDEESGTESAEAQPLVGGTTSPAAMESPSLEARPGAWRKALQSMALPGRRGCARESRRHARVRPLKMRSPIDRGPLGALWRKTRRLGGLLLRRGWHSSAWKFLCSQEMSMSVWIILAVRTDGLRRRFAVSEGG